MRRLRGTDHRRRDGRRRLAAQRRARVSAVWRGADDTAVPLQDESVPVPLRLAVGGVEHLARVPRRQRRARRRNALARRARPCGVREAVPVRATASVLDGVRLVARHGGVVEVRILGTRKGTVSGYFDALDALARAVEPWDGQAPIYATLNPVRPDLLARAVNRLREYAKETTSDRDIVRRAWLVIDCDPARPKGISATGEELAAALARRNEIVAFLQEL